MKPSRNPPLSIEDLDRAAGSPDVEDRRRAMQALLIRIRRDASNGPAALPIFRRVVALERDGWTAALAARGVEDIEGAIAARPVWMALLGRESPDVVANAAGSSTDPWYLPALLDLMNRRHEPEVRGAVIRALGRIPNEGVFPAIIGFLDDPALRVDVIEALADQGDLRARPHLERLVEDETETGDFDDRGAPVRIGYLAWTAIRRFDEPDLARHYGLAVFRPFNHEVWGDPVPPMLGGPPPFRIEPAAPVSTPAAAPPPPAPVPPFPVTSRVASAPVASAPRPVTFPATFMGFQLIAAVPMALAVVEVFWSIFLLAMLAEAIRLGEETPLRTQPHLLDQLGMIPGILGVLAAIAIPFRYRLKTLEYVALVVGALACLPLVLLFAQEWLTR
jgi:hypothetical protein